MTRHLPDKSTKVIELFGSTQQAWQLFNSASILNKPLLILVVVLDRSVFYIAACPKGPSVTGSTKMIKSRSPPVTRVVKHKGSHLASSIVPHLPLAQDNTLYKRTARSNA
ncbi:hypothetical protein IG631_22245 [Alternaria alternata]|nr:hypothetical protein IG631_22245 [Alternaria alternata]